MLLASRRRRSRITHGRCDASATACSVLRGLAAAAIVLQVAGYVIAGSSKHCCRRCPQRAQARAAICGLLLHLTAVHDVASLKRGTQMEYINEALLHVRHGMGRRAAERCTACGTEEACPCFVW